MYPASSPYLEDTEGKGQGRLRFWPIAVSSTIAVTDDAFRPWHLFAELDSSGVHQMTSLECDRTAA